MAQRMTYLEVPARDADHAVCGWYVPDVADALALAVALGGKVISPRSLEGDTYRARPQDPSDNVIGPWQFK